MKSIKVLGTGCAKCEKLHATVEGVAKDLGLEFTLEKVKDINAIMAYGVMMTPALVVDEKVVVSGKVPSKEELQKLLS